MFIFLKICLFIFLLWWVFVAPSAFSSCSKRGLLSSCSAQASHCSGFFCCGAWALSTWAQELWFPDFIYLFIYFPPAAPGSQTLENRLNSNGAQA